MEYELVPEDDSSRLELKGELTYEKTSETTEKILSAVRSRHGPLIVDVSGVTYLSEDGMALIVLLYRDALSRGVPVYLQGAQGPVAERIHRAGLDQFLKPPPSEHEVGSAKG